MRPVLDTCYFPNIPIPNRSIFLQRLRQMRCHALIIGVAKKITRDDQACRGNTNSNYERPHNDDRDPP